MSVTSDVHTLSPVPGLADQLVRRHAALGLTELMRRHTHNRFDVRGGAALALRTLIARARQHRPEEFRAQWNGAIYALRVRRVRGGSYAVVGLRRLGADNEVEAETSRSFSLRLVWAPPRTLASFLQSPTAGGGIYIIEKNGAPRYVGLATQFGSRYRTYGHALNAFDVAPAPYRVRTASMRGTGQLRDAEHAVIRAITKHFGKRTLTNRSSFSAFRASGSGVSLVNAGSRPAYLLASVSVVAGSQYEAGPLAGA